MAEVVVVALVVEKVLTFTGRSVAHSYDSRVGAKMFCDVID